MTRKEPKCDSTVVQIQLIISTLSSSDVKMNSCDIDMRETFTDYWHLNSMDRINEKKKNPPPTFAIFVSLRRPGIQGAVL